jgi:heavy metal efflux system protein
VVSQTGRPDDGTDTTGFFNTEYFVDLKRKEDWRPVFHQDKEAADRRHGQGAWRSFPASSGTTRSPSPTTWKKPSPASRASWPSSSTATICAPWSRRPRDSGADGHGARASRTWASSASSASPTSTAGGPRSRGALGHQRGRHAGRVQTAVGANALTQVQQGEARFDVTLRYQQQYRDTREAIEMSACLRPPASAFRWRN